MCIHDYIVAKIMYCTYAGFFIDNHHNKYYIANFIK